MRRLISALRLIAIALLAMANFVIGMFSMQDYMLFAGLALAAYGLSQVSVPAAYIFPGVILAAVSIAISFKGTK